MPAEPTLPVVNEPVTLSYESPAYRHQLERQRLSAIPVMAPPDRVLPGPQTGQISADGNQGLMFSIDVDHLNIAPGGAAVVTARLHNRGTIVDAMTVDVLGLPTEWLTISPRTVNLFVGAEGVAQIRIAPPLHHSTQRGLLNVEVAAWSGTNPNVRCVQRLDVIVGGFQDIDAQVDPAICVGRFEGKYTMAVTNGGNARMEATVRGVHDEGAVRVMCRPSTLSIAPGSSAAVTVIAKPPFLFTGASVVYNLNLSVQTADHSRTFPVRLKQPPLLSKWLARILLGALAIALVVVAALFLHKHKAHLPNKPHAAAVHSFPAGDRLLVISIPMTSGSQENEVML
jgi:hypothetical protein